jgi:hypothetical protein
MEASTTARVLVVAHKTAATPALLDAVRERAERGPAKFHLLVPAPAPRLHAVRSAPPGVTEGDEVLALALPLLAEAAGTFVDGSVSRRHDPMDAVEEALHDGDYDEIIVSTLPRAVSRWLHIDLPARVAHLGLPVSTVIAEERRSVTSR